MSRTVNPGRWPHSEAGQPTCCLERAGAGQTTVFVHEADETGGAYVTARDFLTFEDRAEWHGKTLHIDGLDERRSGSTDQRSALAQIRTKPDALGQPRSACPARRRTGFGAPDRTALDMVARKERIGVLRLRRTAGRQG